MSENKGILIAMPDSWDERCFAVPALRALESAGFAGGLFIHETASEFWKALSKLPQVTYSDRSRMAHLVDEISGKWKASLVWEDGLAAKVFYKAKVPRRVGTRGAVPAKWLTHPLEAVEGAVEHRVRKYIKTCEEMGIPISKPEFFAPLNHLHNAEPRTLLLCPETDYGISHEWALERWKELGVHLIEKGYEISICTGISKRELGTQLAAHLGLEILPCPLHAMGQRFTELARYEITVASDGSLPHLAALAGSRCITLFGPNNPHWRRPLGKQNRIVRQHVECAPCLSAKCVWDGRCQSELSVERVLAQVLSE